MNLKEYMEKEREKLKWAIPQLKEMQEEYFVIIEDLMEKLEEIKETKCKCQNM